MKKITSSLFLLLLLALPLGSKATHPVNTEDHPTGKINLTDYPAPESTIGLNSTKPARYADQKVKRDAKMEARLEKMLTRHQAKRGIDNLGDTTDRWFWLGAGSWTIGILITIIAGGTIGSVGLGILWLVTFAFGAFSLITWLKKRYGN